ncbi:MAG: hypothetical protein Ct9H90mP10_01740 [Actinomycetota bacterium]|nr:MAG: hypothetical protein Ct9H90mP10_01740 [Actinomycetota bacterium]
MDKDLIIIVAFQQWHQGLVDQSINLLENNEMVLKLTILLKFQQLEKQIS